MSKNLFTKALRAVVLDKQARSRLDEREKALEAAQDASAHDAREKAERQAVRDERKARQDEELERAESIAAKIVEAAARLERMNESPELAALLGEAEQRLATKGQRRTSNKAPRSQQPERRPPPAVTREPAPPGAPVPSAMVPNASTPKAKSSNPSNSRAELIDQAMTIYRQKAGLLDHLSDEDRLRLYVLARKAMGLTQE
ncbi:MAG: hypothetical protein ACPGNT_08590 [Rhodospirillales bacterium]